MTQPPMEEDFQDRIQRILNEKKKDDLRQQYGAQFGEGEKKLHPDVEGEWLDYITEFERQSETAKTITVREKIGNPTVRPLSEISDAEIDAELYSLFELLYQHNIVVDFIHEQEDREVYRFLADELLDAETTDMFIPDMFSHFIYEEFHPNDEDDITMWADEFMDGLFKQEFRRESEMTYTSIEKTNLRDSKGNPVTHEQFIQLIDSFQEMFPVIIDYKGSILAIKIEGDEADLEIDTFWRAILKDEKSIVENTGVTRLKMARSPYGGWGVLQAIIPGWDFSIERNE